MGVSFPAAFDWTRSCSSVGTSSYRSVDVASLVPRVLLWLWLVGVNIAHVDGIVLPHHGLDFAVHHVFEFLWDVYVEPGCFVNKP